MSTRDVDNQLQKRILELEKSFKKLQAENGRLVSAFEATNDGLWELDPRTREAYFNPRWQEMLGYDAGELIASYETWENLLHPEDREKSIDTLKEYLIHHQGTFSIEFRMRSKNGEWRWMHSRGKAIEVDDAGNVSRMIGTHVDITERKNLEHKLRITQFAFDKASIGIYRVSESGKILEANKHACESLGYTPQELYSLSIPDINPNMSLELFLEHRKKLKLTLQNTFETTHRRKDGKIFPVELTVNYHNFEGEEFSLSFQTDISERKAADKALRESQEKLSSIFRASPAGIGLVINRQISDVNEAFCEMVGYTQRELVGQNARLLYNSDEEYEYVGREKYRQIALYNKGTVETSLKCKDGRLIDILMSSSPIDRTNLSAGFTFTALDITSHKQTEKDKARIEAQYLQAQKVEAIGQLAGGVAHDLNNMLTPILAYCDLLLADTALGDPRKTSLEQIYKAGTGARDLVHQLLAFSRRQTLEYKPLDLNQVLTDFELLLRRTIRENIDIHIVKSPEIAPVMADVGQLEQVILNIAINAADSMPGGGQLTIETLPVELDQTYTDAHPGVIPGSYILLAISDTGCGMDEETSSRIFEPFFTTKGSDGTGLGLSTVYGIVKQHNGNIWVYSEPGQGTTFKIYLPLSREIANKEQGAVPAPDDIRGIETILLVEDNIQVADIAEEILKWYGYKVLKATNGKEAVELCSLTDTTIQLLLTDVVMPEMNGKELAQKLTTDYPGLKVLYMSGYTSNVIAHHGVLDQGVQFIQKPFTPHSLATKVREVLDR